MQTLSWTLTLKLPHCVGFASVNGAKGSLAFFTYASCAVCVELSFECLLDHPLLRIRHSRLCFERPSTALRAGSRTNHTVDVPGLADPSYHLHTFGRAVNGCLDSVLRTQISLLEGQNAWASVTFLVWRIARIMQKRLYCRACSC